MTPPHPEPPSIPDFTLLRLVGRGSYGEVWLARGLTGVYRAVKVIHREDFEDPETFAREFNGVTLFARLAEGEPSLLRLFHVGRNEVAGFYFYVMELADDVSVGTSVVPEIYRPRTLGGLNRPAERMPLDDVIRLGIDLSEGLAVLHRNRLVHRDVKPSNVIYIGGIAKLADIGLIAPLGAATYVGTEGFVPPEGPGAPSADVYSLGKLLYELATGLDRRQYPRLPPIPRSHPDAGRLLEFLSVLNRACDPEPARRYGDARAILDDLRVLQAGESIRGLHRMQRLYPFAKRIAMGLGAVAAVAGGGMFIEYQRAKSENLARRWAVYGGVLSHAQREASLGDYSGARFLLSQPGANPPGPKSVEWDLVRWTTSGVFPAWRTSLSDTGILHVVGEQEGPRFLALDDRGQLWLGEDRESTGELDAGVRHAPKAAPARLVAAGVRALGSMDPNTSRWLLQQTNGAVGWFHPDRQSFDEYFQSPLGLGAAAEKARRVVMTNQYHETHFQVWATHAPSKSPVFDLPPDPALPDTWGIGLSPDGRWLAIGRFRIGEQGQRLDLWDVEEGNRVASLPVPEIVWGVSFSPSSRELVAYFDSGTTLRLAIDHGFSTNWVQAIPGRAGYLRHVDDAGTLLVGLDNGEVRLIPPNFDPARSKERPAALVDRLRSVGWLPATRRIFTGNSRGTVEAWASRPRPHFRRYRPAANPSIRETILAPDGTRFAVSSGTNSVDVVQLGDASARTLHGAWRPVAFTRDGQLIAAGDAGRWLAWNIATGESSWELNPSLEDGASSQVCATFDGQYLMALSGTGQLRIWDRSAPRPVIDKKVMAHSPVAWCRASHASVLAGLGLDSTIWTWRPGMAQPVTSRSTTGTPLAAALTADGEHLAFVTTRGFLNFLRTRDLSIDRYPMELPVREAFAMAYTPDGLRLMIGGSNGLIGFFETEKWNEAGAFFFEGLPLGSGLLRPQSFEFDRSGHRLVVALANGDIWWPADPLNLPAIHTLGE